MDDSSRRLIAFRAAGLLGWAAGGIQLVLVFRDVPAARPGLLGAATVLWVAFGVPLALFTRSAHRSSIERIGLLAAQSLCALGLTYLLPHGFEAVLLVVVAAQLPFCLSPRVVAGWILVQTGFFFAIAILNAPFLIAAAVTAAYLGFEVFAAYTAFIAERESCQRAELARLNAELRSTQELLVESRRAAERIRIARDLHDVLGHHLTALALNLEVAGHLTEGPAQEHVEKARSLAKLLLADVRAVVSDFRTAGNVDLLPALRILADEIPRPKIHLEATGSLEIAEPAVAEALLRSVQEIVTNTVKHSGAANLWIELRRTPSGVTVSARDDGRGTPRVEEGHGLSGMRERVAACLGRLELSSAPGAGFRVSIELPAGTGTRA